MTVLTRKKLKINLRAYNCRGNIKILLRKARISSTFHYLLLSRSINCADSEIVVTKMVDITHECWPKMVFKFITTSSTFILLPFLWWDFLDVVSMGKRNKMFNSFIYALSFKFSQPHNLLLMASFSFCSFMSPSCCCCLSVGLINIFCIKNIIKDQSESKWKGMSVVNDRQPLLLYIFL